MKKLLFILILFLCSPKIILAANYDDSFYSAEYISNVYVIKAKNGVNYYRQGRFIRSKSDESPVYCVEPFESLNENIKYKSYDSDQYTKLGISKEKWNKISLISYYGYGFENHTSDKWYYVTQIMIWRILEPDSDFYFTDKLNGEKITSYDDEISEINKLVKNHLILPEFANNIYTYSVDKEISIEDKNGVLKDFTMDIVGNIEIKKENNTLKFYSSKPKTIKLNFIKAIKKYDRPTIVFIDSKAQNVIKPGNPENVSFELVLNIEAGILKINKVDYDSLKKEPSGYGRLIGSEYTLYNLNNEVVDNLIIDENYEAVSKQLAFGTYILKETKSMEGYYLDNKEYLIEINASNLNVELTLKNRAIKSKIELYKYYDNKLEEGISFEIYDINSNLIDVVTTNSEGRLEKELYYGNYLFHQINSTKNYLKVEDFEVKIDEISPEIIRLELHDEKFFSKLMILKVDSKTSEIIKDDVIFNIYDENTGQYLKVDGKTDLKATEGILIIDKIYAGKYIIEEKQAPSGYKKTTKKIEVIIDDQNNFKYDDDNYPIYEISISNDKEIIEIEVPNTSQDYKLEIILFFKRKRTL